jgi:hypothetical protein
VSLAKLVRERKCFTVKNWWNSEGLSKKAAELAKRIAEGNCPFEITDATETDPSREVFLACARLMTAKGRKTRRIAFSKIWEAGWCALRKSREEGAAQSRQVKNSWRLL